MRVLIIKNPITPSVKQKEVSHRKCGRKEARAKRISSARKDTMKHGRTSEEHEMKSYLAGNSICKTRRASLLNAEEIAAMEELNAPSYPIIDMYGCVVSTTYNPLELNEENEMWEQTSNYQIVGGKCYSSEMLYYWRLAKLHQERVDQFHNLVYTYFSSIGEPMMV